MPSSDHDRCGGRDDGGTVRLASEPAARPRRHPTRGGEPDIFQFSGAASLIQPCSQVGGEPDPTLFLASGACSGPVLRPISFATTGADSLDMRGARHREPPLGGVAIQARGTVRHTWTASLGCSSQRRGRHVLIVVFLSGCDHDAIIAIPRGGGLNVLSSWVETNHGIALARRAFTFLGLAAGLLLATMSWGNAAGAGTPQPDLVKLLPPRIARLRHSQSRSLLGRRRTISGTPKARLPAGRLISSKRLPKLWG